MALWPALGQSATRGVIITHNLVDSPVLNRPPSLCSGEGGIGGLQLEGLKRFTKRWP